MSPRQQDSIKKAQRASVRARKAKAARVRDYQEALKEHHRQHVTLPVQPTGGTPDQQRRLGELWSQYFAVQDRIKRIHTARGKTSSPRRKERLMEDLLAANNERQTTTDELRELRRAIVGPEFCKRVDHPLPRPEDFGLTAKDV